MKKGETIFTMGNDAMTAGAIAAGARFYAGYPITPSSEVAELSSVRLPQVGGLYVQMEDELGSMAAIIGASAAGKKSYTATSGPGFSLMQENLGVAVMGEIPCVIVDVMRSGPSTGMATKPAQGDLLQAKWGTHGDHGLIVISPASVQECYDYMITAFNYSEKHRTPVVFLADEVVGHMRETYVKWEVGPEDVVERKSPVCAPADYKPYDFSGQSDDIAPLAVYGGPCVFRINGTTHDESGAPSIDPANADTMIAINDEYADGRDMSWLWDVDFTSLRASGVAMVSGVRAWDMALRLGYDQVPVADTNTDLEQAVTAFVNANPGTRKHIYCTYTAMLKTRAVLGRITEVRDAGVGK